MSQSAPYTFAFLVNSPIRVKGLQAMGSVVAVMRDIEGCQYRVVYYINSERRDQWLFEFELEEI